jgi:hypothetical protein
MLPGQEHLVASLTDCMAFGAHYYNLDTMHLTLEALIIEHFHGENSNSAAHPKAHIMFMQWTLAMVNRLDEDENAIGQCSCSLPPHAAD